MEEAGIKIDCDVLAEMSKRLDRECATVARDIYEKAGVEFNINSPKQLGDVLFNKLNLPKPMKYGKGKTISTAVDVLEGLAAEHEVPQAGARLSPALEAEVDLRGCAARAAELLHAAAAHHVQHGGIGDRAGCRRSIPTCRTFPFAPNWAARFAPPSSPSRDTCC